MVISARKQEVNKMNRLAITWEQPKTKFGKLCFGVTINGQTYWSERKQDLEKTIEQLRKDK